MLNEKQILRHFYGAGGDGKFSGSLDVLNEEIVDEIKSSLPLKVKEDIILVFYKDTSNWVTLGAIYFTIFSVESILCMKHSAIKKVELENDKRDIFDGEWAGLKITDSSDRNYVFKIEIDRPFSGLWHLLTNM